MMTNRPAMKTLPVIIKAIAYYVTYILMGITICPCVLLFNSREQTDSIMLKIFNRFEKFMNFN
jgi:hypothetical protein